MYNYEEACPISQAASVLCERWTLQIVREMLLGASRFSELQSYLPKMSPTLLNSRLKTLERQGIILRTKIREKKGYEYRLTPTGLDLKPVLHEMGKWGMQWVFARMNPSQLNLAAIVRDYAVWIQTDQLPAGHTTIQISVTGESSPIKKFILVRDGRTQVCEENIGNEVDIYLTASLETLGKIWFGELELNTAREQGLLKVVGSTFCVNNLGKWLRTSQFADYNQINNSPCSATSTPGQPSRNKPINAVMEAQPVIPLVPDPK